MAGYMDPELFEIAEVLDPIELCQRWESTRVEDEVIASIGIGLDYFDAPARYAPRDDFAEDWELARASPIGEVDLADADLETSASLGPPPWNIAFSKRFQKDLDGLDRKLAGRVLEVLLEVKDFKLPFSARGDTFKPLSGELAGCWRYRIGDHRLVLKPIPEWVQIAAVSFAARGSVYD